MSSSLKVAMVSGAYPPFSFGGVSAVCYDLATSLSKKGVSTTVFSGKSEKIAIERVNACLRVVRMPIIGLPPRHLWFPTQNLSPLLRMLKDFDVIHNVDTMTAGVLAYFRKNLPKPFITHVHGCGHCETRAFLQSPFYSWSLGEFVFTVVEYPLNEYLVNTSLRHSDHIVVCSAARLDEMKRRNRSLDYSKVSVIYNGINFDRIGYKNSLVEEDDCSVLFWGRMFYLKGIIQLIEAMALVKEDFPKVSLDVCGKGPLEAKVRSLISKLSLKDNVRIHGYVSDEFLIEKIIRATVIVLPSLYEGQPVAALEAMAYRKPLIVYDFPFAREYITDWNNGLTAKGGDVKDLAERIRIALSDKKLRQKLSQNAYERVRKNHNWETLIDQYIKLYNSLAR